MSENAAEKIIQDRLKRVDIGNDGGDKGIDNSVRQEVGKLLIDAHKRLGNTKEFWDLVYRVEVVLWKKNAEKSELVKETKMKIWEHLRHIKQENGATGLQIELSSLKISQSRLLTQQEQQEIFQGLQKHKNRTDYNEFCSVVLKALWNKSRTPAQNLAHVEKLLQIHISKPQKQEKMNPKAETRTIAIKGRKTTQPETKQAKEAPKKEEKKESKRDALKDVYQKPRTYNESGLQYTAERAKDGSSLKISTENLSLNIELEQQASANRREHMKSLRTKAATYLHTLKSCGLGVFQGQLEAITLAVNDPSSSIIGKEKVPNGYIQSPEKVLKVVAYILEKSGDPKTKGLTKIGNMKELQDRLGDLDQKPTILERLTLVSHDKLPLVQKNTHTIDPIVLQNYCKTHFTIQGSEGKSYVDKKLAA